jgi:hypothetical protein
MTSNAREESPPAPVGNPARGHSAGGRAHTGDAPRFTGPLVGRRVVSIRRAPLDLAPSEVRSPPSNPRAVVGDQPRAQRTEPPQSAPASGSAAAPRRFGTRPRLPTIATQFSFPTWFRRWMIAFPEEPPEANWRRTIATVSELLIRRTVFGGRERSWRPTEAFNR